MSIKKGTQFIVMMIDVNSAEYEEFKQETPAETKERFFKHFHSLINDVAKLEGSTPESLKEAIKDTLEREKKIVSSTTELSVEQLAVEISKLQKYKAKLLNK
jgi:flavin-binding protein dodecin